VQVLAKPGHRNEQRYFCYFVHYIPWGLADVSLIVTAFFIQFSRVHSRYANILLI
jgi:hypothetical protein